MYDALDILAAALRRCYFIGDGAPGALVRRRHHANLQRRRDKMGGSVNIIVRRLHELKITNNRSMYTFLNKVLARQY